MNQAIAGVRFETFFSKPTPKRFRDLQNLVIAESGYDSNTSFLHFLERLFEKHHFERLLFHANESPVLLLSPRFHYLVGNAALAIGEQEQADEERFLSRICLKSLLNSGDGSLDEPFRVTYLSDERDIAMALGCDIRTQEVAETTQGICDVMTMHDGSELWFEVDHLHT